MENRRIDAVITMSRKVAAGYRPHLVVGNSEMLGVEFSSVASSNAAGGRLLVSLKLLYSGVNYDALRPGAEFSVLEGPSKVGSGVVLSA